METRNVILKPVITEASTQDLDSKRYVFDVDPRATKPQIKAAVEQIFEVKVIKVNVMNVKGKKKRVGRYVGYTNKRRKAIVTLSSDSKAIKFFEK
jgi:large subunit ribosomal protein L23